MPTSENLKEEANNLDKNANDLFMEATALLTDLTTRGQEINEPYLSDLLEILADDNLIGDLDRLGDLRDRLGAETDKQRWHIFRRAKTVEKGSGMLERFVDAYNLKIEWLHRLAKIWSLIDMAKSYREFAIGHREMARLFELRGS